MQCFPVLLLDQDKSKAELELYLSGGSQHSMSPFCHQPRMIHVCSAGSWAENVTLKKGSVMSHLLGREMPCSAPVAAWAKTATTRMRSHRDSWEEGENVRWILLHSPRGHLRLGPIKVSTAMDPRAWHPRGGVLPFWCIWSLPRIRGCRAARVLRTEVPALITACWVPNWGCTYQETYPDTYQEPRTASGQWFPLQ